MRGKRDPRRAKTLEEAARNPDGTYNGARALSWLSEALCPGRGISEAEVMKMWDDKKKEKRDATEGRPSLYGL